MRHLADTSQTKVMFGWNLWLLLVSCKVHLELGWDRFDLI